VVEESEGEGEGGEGAQHRPPDRKIHAPPAAEPAFRSRAACFEPRVAASRRAPRPAPREGTFP